MLEGGEVTRRCKLEQRMERRVNGAGRQIMEALRPQGTCSLSTSEALSR